LSSGHAIASVDGNGSVIAACDVLGRTPLFWRQVGGGEAYLSNVPRLLKTLDTDRYELQLRSDTLASLQVNAQIWGSGAFYEDAELLPTGHLVSAHQGSMTLSKLDDFWWDCEPGREPEMCDYEESAEILTKTFDSIARMTSRDFILGLSGGKDSRLLATYAAESGLAGRLRFFTSGLDGSPEFDVAQRLASMLGIDWESRISAPSGSSPEEILTRLEAQVGRYDAMLLPVAGFAHSHQSSEALEIAGFGGEVLRGGLAKQFRTNPLADYKEAMRRWPAYHLGPDPLGVIQTRTLQTFEELTAGWVRNQSVSNLPLTRLPEKYFADYRVPWHQGLAWAHSAVRQSLDPLVNHDVLRNHLRLGPKAGVSEMAHFSLLMARSPDAARIPFVNDSWNAELSRHVDTQLFPKDVVPVRSPDTSIRPMGWSLLESQRLMTEVMLESMPSELFDSYRVPELAQICLGPPIDWNSQKAIQAFTLIGLHLRLSGRYSVPRDGLKTAVRIDCSERAELWRRHLVESGLKLASGVGD